MTDLTKLAHEVGEAIENSAEFKTYNELKAKQETDSELQMLIGEYNLRRMGLMNEMQKEVDQQDKETLERLRNEMNDAYLNVTGNPLMKEYTAASEELQKLINSVYQIINFHVTGEDPSSCGGNCASCHGCH